MDALVTVGPVCQMVDATVMVLTSGPAQDVEGAENSYACQSAICQAVFERGLYLPRQRCGQPRSQL
jgi:hypothetical protein